MVTPNSNQTWIKYHLKLETNSTPKAFASQGIVFDDLADLKNSYHKVACFTERNPGDENKEANISSIIEARLTIAICAIKYYEDVGNSIEPNIM